MRILLILILLSLSQCIQAQSNTLDYIDKFDSLAIEVMNTYGIPASLVIGLAIHESAAGNSSICKVKHNHFGVKGRVRSSKTKSGYANVYRKFESDEDSYMYFGEMLSRKNYYPELKDNMDYMNWLKALKAGKYATSSSWISKVDNIIKRYDLTRFDMAMPFHEIDLPQTPDLIREE